MNPVPPPSEVETLTVGAAARRLGIAAPTLRSWERRYGLSPSRRSAGGHRRYSQEDLARLLSMLQLVNRGVPTAAAAEAVRDQAFSPADLERDGTATPVLVEGGMEAVGDAGQDTAKPGSRRRSVRRPRDEPSESPEGLADLFALANAFEAERLTFEIARHLDREGVIPAWTNRLAPLLVQVGDQWERTGSCVEVEHLASEAVAGGLRYHTRRAVERFMPDPAERPVVLACLEREDHALPLLALTAALAERAVRVRTLGAATPIDALSSAVRQIRPAAVFIWSSTPATADPVALRTLARTRPGYALVVGGPGWQALGSPKGWVKSLDEAVDAMVNAARR